jgi:hypothetical protein
MIAPKNQLPFVGEAPKGLCPVSSAPGERDGLRQAKAALWNGNL